MNNNTNNHRGRSNNAPSNNNKRYFTAEIKEEGVVFDSEYYKCKLAPSNLEASDFLDLNLTDIKGTSPPKNKSGSADKDSKESSGGKARAKPKRRANQKMKVVIQSKPSEEETKAKDSLIAKSDECFSQMMEFEYKTIVLAFCMLLIPSKEYRLKIGVSAFVTLSLLQNIRLYYRGKVKGDVKPEHRKYFVNFLIFSCLETAIYNLTIFMTTINLEKQHAGLMPPLQKFDIFVPLIYSLVVLARHIFMGLILYNEYYNSAFSFMIGLISRCFVTLVLVVLTGLFNFSWALILAFLWLFFALVGGLAFSNGINLVGKLLLMAFKCSCDMTIVYYLMIFLHGLSNTLLLFAFLFVFTREDVLVFDEPLMRITVVAVIMKVTKKSKIFNFSQILNFLKNFDFFKFFEN